MHENRRFHSRISSHIRSKIQKGLARVDCPLSTEAQEELFDEKTEGQKSRDSVPFVLFALWRKGHNANSAGYFSNLYSFKSYTLTRPTVYVRPR
jgi:hypothetical protein